MAFSFFSSKNAAASKEVISASAQNKTQESMFSRMAKFAGKVSLVLGLSSAVALPPKSESVASLESVAAVKTVPASSHGTIKTLPVSTPASTTSTQKTVAQATKKENTEAPIRTAKARKGDSVSGFMLRNFQTTKGWTLLVEKETGDRIENPNKDLIAGRTYALAKNETIAQHLTGIFQNQASKKVASKKMMKEVKTKTEEVKGKMDKVPPSPKNSVVWKGGYTTSESFIQGARNLLGTPYKWGGTSKKLGVDCSGLFQNVLIQTGAIDKNSDRLVSYKIADLIVQRKTPDTVKAGDVIYIPLRRKNGSAHVVAVTGEMTEDGRIPTIQSSGSKKKVVEGFTTYEKGMVMGTPAWIASKEEIASGKTIVSTVAANDASFMEEAPKASLMPEQIPLTEVAVAENIYEKMNQEQKSAVIESIKNDRDIRAEVRQSVLEKLEGTTDMVAFYQKNLDHYTPVALRAKKELPELRKSFLRATRNQEFAQARSLQNAISGYEKALKLYSDTQKLLSHAQASQKRVSMNEMEFKIAA